MIDLRSDTLTRPSPAMREAMARAEVGDDVYGEDPTVRALEVRTAEILGKEDACFVPSGTMSNQIGLRVHTEPGDEVLADAGAHILHAEAGAPAALSGLLVRALPGVHGIFSAEDVRAAIRPPSRFSVAAVYPRTRLVEVENTHNLGGGVVWPLAALEAVAAAAREHGLETHLDGARLWNAAVATGIAEAELAAPFDTVNVCFSKGLGAPVGSALAGSAETIARARRLKQLFGGGMRQAGIVAAGALYALEHHRADLADDHDKARRFAEGLAAIEGVAIDLDRVQTNIVRFSVPLGAVPFVEACFERGLRLLPSGDRGARAVFHRDVGADAVEAALAIVRDVLLSRAA